MPTWKWVVGAVVMLVVVLAQPTGAKWLIDLLVYAIIGLIVFSALLVIK